MPNDNAVRELAERIVQSLFLDDRAVRFEELAKVERILREKLQPLLDAAEQTEEHLTHAASLLEQVGQVATAHHCCAMRNKLRDEAARWKGEA